MVELAVCKHKHNESENVKQEVLCEAKSHMKVVGEESITREDEDTIGIRRDNTK